MGDRLDKAKDLATRGYNAAQVKAGEVLGSGADVEGAVFQGTNIAAAEPKVAVAGAAVAAVGAAASKIRKRGSHADGVEGDRAAQDQDRGR